MLTKEKLLNSALSALYLVLPKEVAEHHSQLVLDALQEQREAGRRESEVDKAEETRVQQRLLAVMQEQFKCYYQGFDGTFDEWIELRGLRFNEDRFISVPYDFDNKGRYGDYLNHSNRSCQPSPQMIMKQDSCKEKAAAGEPTFTLRGQDGTAAAVVRYWVSLNRRAPINKLIEALQISEKMQDYTPKKQAD